MAFLSRSELTRYGIGDITVDAVGAWFLAALPMQMSALKAKAEAIGPPPMFMTAQYGNSWDPWWAQFQSLYDQGISILKDPSEARSTFIESMRDLRNASSRIRQQEKGAFDLFVQALTSSPLNTLRYVVGNDLSAVGGDLGNAAGATYPNALAWAQWAWEKRYWIGGALALAFVAPQAVGLAAIFGRRK